MASIVQSPPPSNVATGASVSVTWNQATATGNTLVAVVVTSQQNGDTGAVSAPAGWSPLGTRVDNGGQDPTIDLFIIEGAASRSGAEQFSYGTGSTQDIGVILLELSGLVTADVLDQHAIATGLGVTASSGTTPSTTQADEHALAFIVQKRAEGQINPTNGFSLVGSLLATGSGSTTQVQLGVYERALTTIGTYETSVTITSRPWAGTIITLKTGVAGPAAINRTATDDVSLPPATAIQDSFDRSTSNGWGGNWDAPSNPTLWSTNGSRALMDATSTAAENIVYDEAGDWSGLVDAEGLVKWNLSRLPGAHEYDFIWYSRRGIDSGTLDAQQYSHQVVITTTGAIEMGLERQDAGVETPLVAETAIGKTYAAGEDWWLRWQAIGSNPTLLKQRVWKDGTPEPSTWDLEFTDSVGDLSEPGTTGVRVSGDGSAVYPMQYQFDDLSYGDPDAVSLDDTISHVVTPGPTGPLLQELFDGGADGVTIGTGNTSFDSVVGAPVFDDAHSLGGRMSAHVPGANNHMEWSTAWGTRAESHIRFYFYVEDLPASTFRFAQMLWNGSSLCMGVDLRSNGVIAIKDSTNTDAGATAVGIPADTWIRFEADVLHNGSGLSELDLRLYWTDPDGSTPDATITGLTADFGTQSTKVRTPAHTASSTVPIWISAFAADPTTQPGPFAGTGPANLDRTLSDDVSVPLPNVVHDTFSRVLASDGYGTTDSGHDWEVDPDHSVDGSKGISTFAVEDSDSPYIEEDLDVLNQRVTFRIATSAVAAGGVLRFSAMLRHQFSTITYYKMEVVLETDQEMSCQVYTIVNNVQTQIGANAPIARETHAAFPVWYWCKAEAEGTNPTTLRLKVWRDGTSEPVGWDYEMTDSEATLQTGGSAGVHLSAFNQLSYPFEMYLDDFDLDDLDGTDADSITATVESGVTTVSLRPDADLGGSWHGEDDRTTNLYQSVDDEPFSDSTYVESPDNPTSTDFAEFSLPPTGDPGIDTHHTIRYRYSGPASIVVELRQGSTIIKSWTHTTPSATPVLAEQVLTEGEAATITDYSDLRIRVRGA